MGDKSHGRKLRSTLWRDPFVTEDAEGIKRSFVRHMQASLGRDEFSSSAWERYQAVCLSVREHLIRRWIHTQQTYYHTKARRIYFLSMEYMLGRILRNALYNLGIFDTYQEALRDFGLDFQLLEAEGSEPALGNGGLGRIAACFLDSMATMGLPAYGFGLRYNFGIFRQRLAAGHQIEDPDDWLQLPNPWEIPRPETQITIQFGGRVNTRSDANGKICHDWIETEKIAATPFDTPIPGYGNNTVNTLRLWSARGTENFDLEDFKLGKYVGAVERSILAENITKVLYPDDSVYLGKELRFKQQYFLVSATLQDVIRRHLLMNPSVDNLVDKAVFQLNDTHPAMTVAELMRILVDEQAMPWDRAWEITSNSIAYTNHTLLPEASDVWPVDLFNRLLPRHLQIISQINAWLLEEMRSDLTSNEMALRRISIFEEQPIRGVRMSHLAAAASFSINGVAELHTRLLKSRVMPEFARLWPKKFSSQTNGISPRRWLLCCNPPLANLITSKIGDGWITDLAQLKQLEEKADDEFLESLTTTKKAAKDRLAQSLQNDFGERPIPESIFDVQAKRFHEYKRQLLNALHIVHLYAEVKRDPSALRNPRTFMFSGKAAPGYQMAKLHVKLINNIATRINSDPHVSSLIKVIFVPDYNVTRAEMLIPAADISEQISTVGFEACGTGNMKFALNGALTVATLDGANIEIARAVGKENIFILGGDFDSVERMRGEGYRPRAIYESQPAVREVIDMISSDFFSQREPGIFQPIVDSLLQNDFYLVLSDFENYRMAHKRADEVFSDRRRRQKMILRNIARIGVFSSDRTVNAYNDHIWHLSRMQIEI